MPRARTVGGRRSRVKGERCSGRCGWIRARVPGMDMLKGEQIAEANLTDWRKLAQGLHARYVVDDFGAGARSVAAVGEAGDALGHHPRVSIGDGYVDLRLVTDDAIYRDDDGTEYVIEWVTQQDVDLARRGSPRSPPTTGSTPTRPRSATSSSASTRRTLRPSPRCC